MSRNDEELRKQLDCYDDEPDLVVNRQSQSNTSILPIFILFVGLYFIFNFYSKHKQTVQDLVKAVTSKAVVAEKLAPKALSNNDAKPHQIIINGKVDEVKQALLTDKKAINEVMNGMTPIMLAASIR